MPGNRIAILIPNFNSGPLLAETVDSVFQSGLSGQDCAIIVADNASTDGSADALYLHPACGIAVTIRRHRRNIGRIANWNAVMLAAEEAGFRYAMFLMAGDRLKGDGILALRAQMEMLGANLGIAPYIVTDALNRPERFARRICWRGGGTMDHRSFVAQSLARGCLLHGPLGANLYRIDGAVRLRFDPADESHTDQIATAAFVAETRGRICYHDLPVSFWRRRPGRFHSSISADQRLDGDMRVIREACGRAGVSPDYARIRASLFLRGAALRRGAVWTAWRKARVLTQGVSMSWSWLLQMLLRQLCYGTPWIIQA